MKNYDQEIEKRHHPENFEMPDEILEEQLEHAREQKEELHKTSREGMIQKEEQCDCLDYWDKHEDIDPNTGHLTMCHLDRCSGCSLCESDV